MMVLVDESITLNKLREMAAGMFGDFVKAVVDVDREVMAVDGELHSDLESFLLMKGSKQASLWGINLYPDAGDDDLIEFDSLINMRPANGNRSRGVENKEIAGKIIGIVIKRVKK